MPPGHGPAGDAPPMHDSQVRLADLLWPTAKLESSFCRLEPPHLVHVCFRELLFFSRNSQMNPQSLHLYSNNGTVQSPI